MCFSKDICLKISQFSDTLRLEIFFNMFSFSFYSILKGNMQGKFKTFDNCFARAKKKEK